MENIVKEKIFIQGLSVAYTQKGTGASIVILHGWGRGLISWKQTQDLICATGFQVTVPDLPGFGNTPSPYTIWGVYEYAEFIYELCIKLQLKRIILVGHSFGGAIASVLAAEHPELVSRLVLVAAAVIREKPGLKLTIMRIAANIIARALLLFSETAQNTIKKIGYKILGTGDYARANGMMKAIFKKVVAQNLELELARVTQETTLLWGKNDSFTPLTYGKRIEHIIPHATLRVFSNSGHNLHLEHPQEIAHAISSVARSV